MTSVCRWIVDIVIVAQAETDVAAAVLKQTDAEAGRARILERLRKGIESHWQFVVPATGSVQVRGTVSLRVGIARRLNLNAVGTDLEDGVCAALDLELYIFRT